MVRWRRNAASGRRIRITLELTEIDNSVCSQQISRMGLVGSLARLVSCSLLRGSPKLAQWLLPKLHRGTSRNFWASCTVSGNPVPNMVACGRAISCGQGSMIAYRRNRGGRTSGNGRVALCRPRESFSLGNMTSSRSRHLSDHARWVHGLWVGPQ